VRRRLVFSTLIATLVAACAPPPARPAPPPPAPKEETPPPPPKCEALSEKCAVERGARTKIGEGPWSIALPATWTYARGDAVVAVTDSAALTVTTYEVSPKSKPKEKMAARDAAIAQAGPRIDVKLPQKFAWPKSPKRTSKIGGVDVSLYQFGGATLADASGPLLIFTAPVAPDRVLMGLAFVSNKDASNADAAILESIGSLQSESAPAAGADAGSAR
jgi:hypothetical protein